MSKFPALPLWVDAWSSDTNHLNNEEIGIYLRLLIEIWKNSGCKIPNNDEWIERRLRTPIAQVRAIIKEFCDNDGNWITQRRLQREYKFVGINSRRQAVRAKSRWDKKKNYAAASIRHASGIAPTPTPTPTDIKKERDARACEDGTLVPDDLEFDSAQLVYLDQHGLGLDRAEILFGFKNWHKDQGRKSHNWNARLWTWLKRAATEQSNGKTNGASNDRRSGPLTLDIWEKAVDQLFTETDDNEMRGGSSSGLSEKRFHRSN